MVAGAPTIKSSFSMSTDLPYSKKSEGSGLSMANSVQDWDHTWHTAINENQKNNKDRSEKSMINREFECSTKIKITIKNYNHKKW